MFGFDEHEQVYGQPQHQAKFSHELIAGAASFEAVKLFEDHQRQEGKPVSHAFAKEAIAAIAGAEVDKLFETKGLDYLDRNEARRQAVDQAQRNYDNHYGGQPQWSPEYQPPFDYNQYNYGRPAPQYPPQGYPAQGYDYQPQGYPPQGYPPQGYPPQGYPPQGYPPQGYPPQGYAPQGYQSQGYPPQGYPPQGYPPQGYPPQGYPPQDYPPQGGYGGY